VYAQVAYLLPNESEAALLLGRELSDEADIFWALDAFRQRGVAQPLITLGSRGVAMFAEGRPTIRSVYPVEPVDTTAAGDTFTGALASAVADGMPLTKAVDLAQLAAAICVTRPGAQKSIPTLAEVRAHALFPRE
jgi:ribokinase